MKYLFVIEGGGNGFSGYFPDVPGYAAAGDTLAEVVAMAEEGLSFHLADEDELPQGHSLSHHVKARTVDMDDDSLSFFYVDHEPALAAR